MEDRKIKKMIIIGAGVAGLCAALTIAESGEKCVLVSASPSERAQSNLAAGGINAAFGKEKALAEDTWIAGENLANEDDVKRLAAQADETMLWLRKQGIPFQTEEGNVAVRKLGGHRNGRTYFAGSITGKAIMSALIDQVRKYEAAGFIERKPHHILTDLLVEKKRGCYGCVLQDRYEEKQEILYGSVVLASGGMSGLFLGKGTGVRENDASVTAIAFDRGVQLGNLEFIQYHPTTISIPGKQCLISEAARSEGVRFYVTKDGNPWYFLEEKYGPEGNLVSRDRIVKEFWEIRQVPGVSGPIYLDMQNISNRVWEQTLPCLRELCLDYLNLDPKKDSIPIEEGIHYFMGGILTDHEHRTNIKNLYAAGECACIYHGANRLGGNSLLGAVYGGKTAARTAMAEQEKQPDHIEAEIPASVPYNNKENNHVKGLLGAILCEAMAPVRSQEGLCSGISRLQELENKYTCSGSEKRQIRLGLAMLKCALSRKESRGAHIRLDYPEKKEAYQMVSVAEYIAGKIDLSYQTP